MAWPCIKWVIVLTGQSFAKEDVNLCLYLQLVQNEQQMVHFFFFASVTCLYTTVAVSLCSVEKSC